MYSRGLFTFGVHPELVRAWMIERGEIDMFLLRRKSSVSVGQNRAMR